MATLENTILQVSADQNLSEERFLVGYKSTAESNMEIAIINIADLTAEELAIYESFKALATSKIPV